MRKYIRNHLIWLLALFLAFAGLSGCSGKTAYKKEENPGKNAATYPYVVRTPSVELYLAKEDIELLGEDAFYEGMNRLLKDLEADFEDARNALKRYIRGEVPPIKIYTDFSGRTEYGQRAELGGLYKGDTVDIHVFHNWERAGYALLHEYTHYLSLHCCSFELSTDFWREGLAEYVSMIRCRNRMAKEVDYAVSAEEKDELLKRGAGGEDGKLDGRRLYYGTALIYRSEKAIGMPYVAVSQAVTRLTESQLQNPLMSEMSYYEAACIFEYLVDYYGDEKVFSHLDITGKQMENVYGKTFIEIVEAWSVENARKCNELGLKIDL